MLGAQRRVINFASEAGGVFAEEVTFELDFERRALHKTKSGPRAKRFSLGNQCSHRGEGQPAAGWLPGAPCPEDRGLGSPRPREPASSLEAVLGLCLLSAIFSHWPERAPCSKQTPLVSALERNLHFLPPGINVIMITFKLHPFFVDAFQISREKKYRGSVKGGA